MFVEWVRLEERNGGVYSRLDKNGMGIIVVGGRDIIVDGGVFGEGERWVEYDDPMGRGGAGLN